MSETKIVQGEMCFAEGELSIPEANTHGATDFRRVLPDLKGAIVMKLAERTRHVAQSYTIGISMKAREMMAQGRDVLNLSVGEPDFKVPERAKHAAVQALELDLTKYDKVPGVLELRQEICRKLKEENNLDYEPDQIVVSNGAKQAIMNTLLAVTDPGDEVLMPVPYWTSYPEIVKLCGGVPVFAMPADRETYKITPADLEKALTDKTKILIFNNPSNPAGTVYNEEEVRAIGQFCLEKGIWLLSDEIYEKFCFVDPCFSVAATSPEVKDITILVNGLSKSVAMTGLRVGYTASNRKIASAISKMQGHLTSHTSTLSQWVGRDALKYCGEEIEAQIHIYQKRREALLRKLQTLPDVTWLEPDGAFYVMVNFGAYKDKIEYEESFSVALCRRILEEAEVAIVPGIAFGLDDYARIAYVQEEKRLEEGLERIEKFLRSLK